MKKKKWLWGLCACVMACVALPMAASAADEIGYYEATASGRTYNGTNVVAITDFVFAGVFVGDEVSADGDGILFSPNAGTYTQVDATHLILKGKDKDWYSADYDMVIKNVPLAQPVVISEAEPAIEIKADDVVYRGSEFTVTAEITNNFDYNDGLPLAEEISMTVENARLKEGSAVIKEGNQYSAVFVAADDMTAETMTVSVNVLDAAANYSPLAAPVQKTIGLKSDANYAIVDAAIQKANGLNRENYKDFSKVDAAIAAVVRDKDFPQTKVDAMAQAIEDAIAALEYKDADYTAVDAAIQKAEGLKKEDYKDFSGVDAAVNAVVRGKNITQQTEVDAMAQAIEDAIAALETKPADTETDVPKTGEETGLLPYILLAGVSGAAVAVLARGRKNKHSA